jgi:iron complex transport system substrate-binding protein
MLSTTNKHLKVLSNSLLAAVTVASMSLSCLAAANQNTYPLTLTNEIGETFVVDSKPVKISSKMLFTDELLIELVEPSRLSSLTNLASDITFSNVTNRVPEGVALLDMNVEQIIANQPDIVFAANWTDAGKVSQLRNAGISVYLIDTPYTFEGVQQQILKIGQIVGESAKAAEIIKKMDDKLSENLIIPRQTKTGIDYNSWGASSTKSSTWHSILTQAHVTNLVADYESDQYGQAKMSKELVVQLNPQLLFIPGWIYGDETAASDFEKQVLSDPALSMVEAVKTNNVIAIPERLRGTYSQYIADTIIYVNNAVYGRENATK